LFLIEYILIDKNGESRDNTRSLTSFC
jgi:centrin-1